MPINKNIKFTSQIARKGGKILFCGNGGSAAQAEHFSTEFLVRLNPNVNRNPYPIIPLSFNNSHLTACANDYHFEDIFWFYLHPPRPYEILGRLLC